MTIDILVEMERYLEVMTELVVAEVGERTGMSQQEICTQMALIMKDAGRVAMDDGIVMAVSLLHVRDFVNGFRAHRTEIPVALETLLLAMPESPADPYDGTGPIGNFR